MNINDDKQFESLRKHFKDKSIFDNDNEPRSVWDLPPGFSTSTIAGDISSVRFFCPICEHKEWSVTRQHINTKGQYSAGNDCCKKYDVDEKTIFALQAIHAQHQQFIAGKREETHKSNFLALAIIGVLPMTAGALFYNAEYFHYGLFASLGIGAIFFFTNR